MKKIVIDDAVPYAEAIFSHLGEVVLMPGRDISANDVKNADALIIRSRTNINQQLLQRSSVEFIGSTVVGLDHVDQQYLTENDIQFYSAQGCNANSVSEYVISCLLFLAETHNFQLSEKSIGIIGVGHVGKLLEQKANALGMTVLLNDPPRQNTENLPHFVDLKTALSADIVSFHTPLTQTGSYPSYHLLNRNTFKYIRPDTILINAARGGIIDETTWANTPTQANVIDCWESEPHISETLYRKADIATPHIAGHALEAKLKGSSMVYQALCNFWKKTPIMDWQKHTPKPSIQLQADNEAPFQKALYDLINSCYDPTFDHKAMFASNIDDVYKKFEYYRRHYPTHHEWTEHTIKSTRNQVDNITLKSLGFKVLGK